MPHRARRSGAHTRDSLSRWLANRRLTAALLAVTAAAVAVGGLLTLSRSVQAQGLPAPREALGMEVVGYSNLGQSVGGTSDVWVHGDLAMVGYFQCNTDTGSSVVDISDRANPQVIFQTEPMSRTFANDVKALSIDNASYSGSVFLEPHDRCRRDGPPAEMRIWQLDGMNAPTLLSSVVTGDGVHNAYPFERNDAAYVLLAAPYADTRDNDEAGWEDVDLDADFAIVDVTDPAQPAIVGRWNAHDEIADLPSDTFLHDVWANAAGTIAYAAYWDAGLILLDIEDPTAPKMISRLTYGPDAAGNTHAAVPLTDENYVVITDEDFGPTDSTFEVLAPASIAGKKPHYFGSFGTPLEGKPPLSGDLIYVGRGCVEDPARNIPEDDPYLADPRDKIAVILRGACTFSTKVGRAEAAGAKAAVIVNNDPTDGVAGLGGWDRNLTIPAVGISLDDGNAITNTLSAGETVSVRMGLLPGEWGYTRIADFSDLANPRLVSEIVLPQTRMYPPADGTWSVHNPWVVGDSLYLSHYWGGVRIYDVSDPANPTERAYLVPSDRVVSPSETYHSSIWGVMTDESDLIYASDMLNGLWILRESTSPSQTATPPPTLTPTPQVSPPPPTPTTMASATPTVPTALPPPNTPTTIPTIVPQPTPGGPSVCPHIQNGKVPAAAIAAALANPGRVAGYNQPNDPSKPAHEIWNPRRLQLSIRAYSKPYHPLFNGLVFKAGCP